MHVLIVESTIPAVLTSLCRSAPLPFFQAANSKKAFENLETSLIYSKFRSIATRVRDQVNVITDRLDQAPEHAELLDECKKVGRHGSCPILVP